MVADLSILLGLVALEEVVLVGDIVGDLFLTSPGGVKGLYVGGVCLLAL